MPLTLITLFDILCDIPLQIWPSIPLSYCSMS